MSDLRSGPFSLRLLLALPFLAMGCREPTSVRWISLAEDSNNANEMRSEAAVLPDGQQVVLERRDGEIWGRVVIDTTTWKKAEVPTILYAPAPLLGLGRPAYELVVDGTPCRRAMQSDKDVLQLVKIFEPGTFGYWRNSIFLGIEEGQASPVEAILRVRLDIGKTDAKGFYQVNGRRFSGKGIPLWPGRKFERFLDVPPGSTLSFGSCMEPASALQAAGKPHTFRVLLNGKPLHEHKQEYDPAGSYAWNTVALPEGGGMRLSFEVKGEFAYTSIMDPVVGPTDKGTYASRSRPSIVLFLADTFRADNLAFYGGEEGVTPELGRFAEQSLRFQRAWSVGTFTLPGHSSLFSGLYPRQTSSDAFNSALPSEVETIAEVLSRSGYRTGAITDSGVVSFRFGLNQGFDWFDECDIDLDSTLERARDFLDADDGRPAFLFVQTYRTHLPYREHEPPDAPDTAGTEEYRELVRDMQRLGSPRQALESNAALALNTADGLKNLYRRCATDLDRGFGTFLRDLSARGFPSAGYVLFTSDHGEAFFEHEELYHQGKVFEEQIRIPLLIHGPNVAARASQNAASLIDIPPTLAAMAGVPPLPYWQGTNLLQLDHERPLFAFECAETELSTVAIIDGPRKLIALEETAASRLEQQWMAFDLEADPEEKINLATGESPWPEELFRSSTRIVEALLVPLIAGEASTLDADQIEELNALGYGSE